MSMNNHIQTAKYVTSSIYKGRPRNGIMFTKITPQIVLWLIRRMQDVYKRQMGGRLCDSYKRQKRRNGECSLDTDPGFEADVLRQPMTPDEHIEARETTFALYDALAQLCLLYTSRCV